MSFLQVTLVSGDEKLVKVGPVDMVRTEKFTGKAITDGDDPSITEVYYLAYSAAKRAGFAGSDFEAWLEDVDSIEEVSDPKA
jgi:hypothetical protein